MPADNRPRLEKATRFFARPESFTLECPACGLVYQVRLGTKQTFWDHTTSIFQCSAKGGCQKVYVLGIVAWPVSPRAWIKGTPRDQVPNVRQLAQLRKEGGGWWLADSEKQRYETVHESNLTIEPNRPQRDEDEEEPEH